jgi:small basic protein
MSSSPNRLGPSERSPGDADPLAADRNPLGMIGIAAVAIGIVLGLFFHPSVPEVVQPYLPIAVVAALDAVFGGLRAYLERIFDPKVFVVSFVFNVLVAALIVYVGDQLGVGTQLSTAIIVVLGIRIFGNAAALRRRLFGA